jgi:plasmid stabilization system protein ParE
MTKRVRITFTSSALRDTLELSRSWVIHHPSKVDAFDEELGLAVQLLEAQPEAAPRTLAGNYKNGRVKVMIKTGHLIVYRYARSSRVITILRVLAARATPERP